MIYAFTDRLNGTFGVRYTKEQKDFERNPGTFFPTIDPQDVSSRISIDTMSRCR